MGFCESGKKEKKLLEIYKACNVSPSRVFSHSAIERIYKEHCEENSKEQPEYLDSNISEDLMLTDSTMWAKVRRPDPIFI